MARINTSVCTGTDMGRIRKALAIGDLFLCLALAVVYGIWQNGNWGRQQVTAVSGAEDKEEEQPVEMRRIALTFDDGPHPCYTEELLDGLKERGVCVTFFVTGEHAEIHPDIIKRMQEDA